MSEKRRSTFFFLLYWVWPLVWILVLLTAFTLVAYIDSVRP